MAVIAAAMVATPLLRDRRSRVLGGVAALVLILASAGLYRLWSTWDWNAPSRPAGAGPDVLAMVSKLEARLRDQPNDLQGWLMLGRSYLALERLDDAIVAFDHAHRLGPGSAEAALGLGEAMSLRAGGQITPPASDLFEEGLKLEPGNPRALLYAGFAAAVRGDAPLARSRWEALKALHPPPEIEQLLDARIAELDAPGAVVQAPGGGRGEGQGSGTPPDSAGAPSVGGTGGGVPSADASAASAPGTARALVNLSIAPALKGRLRADAALFVFAREPGSRGPPLAVKRLTSAALGTQVQLSAADSMVAGLALAAGQKVSITARVSFSGQPAPAAGDLYGELTYDVGRDGVRDLVIDHVTE